MFGPPGAGKGTQANRLKALLKLPVIASGDIFRSMGRASTPLAMEVRGYLDRGDFVPDELTIEVVLTRLREPDATNGFILDGFPRTISQASALDRFLEEKGQKVDAALHITAPTEVLEDRLSSRVICPHCNTIYNLVTKPPRNDMTCDLDGHTLERRTDGDINTIRARLATHVRETRPLNDYYRGSGVLLEIDGSRPVDVVEHEIDTALGLERKGNGHARNTSLDRAKKAGSANSTAVAGEIDSPRKIPLVRQRPI